MISPDGYDYLPEPKQLRAAIALVVALVGMVISSILVILRIFDVLPLGVSVAIGLPAFLVLATALAIFEGYGAMGTTLAAQSRRRAEADLLKRV